MEKALKIPMVRAILSTGWEKAATPLISRQALSRKRVKSVAIMDEIHQNRTSERG
jgi:hypothetical protein